MATRWIIYSILIGSTSIWGAYLPAKIAWIDYSKNCLEFFSQEVDFKNIPLLIKEYKWKYLSCFIFFIIIFVIYYTFMIYINWFLLSKLIIIYEIIIMLFSFIGFAIFFSLYWKNIKALSAQTKTKAEAIINFDKYQNENKEKQIKTFKIFKDGQININNSRFQLNQRLYKWRIKRLLKQKISQEKYNFKLLKLYIKYLKVYGVFFKRMKYFLFFNQKIRSDFYNYYLVLENNYNESLETLPKILINNFFAFVAIAEQELNLVK